ncbi:MAG: DUF3574 domain-containing protein [Acetobacteraceae bacterium]|jgi:hypothetical protein|nr:DUF3574 domain-containing protein [Acetobacteraceae bacterium]
MIARRAAIAGLLALPACAAPAPSFVQSTLYLGRSIPAGGEVNDEALARFVAEEITPRFPEGFTLVEGSGAWRDRARGDTIRERTMIVILVHPPARRAAVEEIASAYARRFGQQSVLRVESPAEVRF